MNTKLIISSAILLSFFNAASYSQIEAKPKTLTRLEINNLNISIQVDTTANSSFLLNDSTLKIQFNKPYFFELFVNEESSKIDKIKSKFKNKESQDTIDSNNLLVKYSDSSSFKLNDLLFWKLKKSWRTVPAYWGDKYVKTKLNYHQMTELIKTDKISWQKSNSAIIYYTENPKTNSTIHIKGGFRNNGVLPKGVEERLKKIVSSIKFL